MTKRQLTASTALLITVTACADGPVHESGAIVDVEPAAAMVPLVDFTASDMATALLDPGTVRVADGKVLIRGLTAQYRWDGSDPRITGNGIVVANGDLDALDGTGPVWGEINDFVSDQGDHWSGHWHGHRRQNGAQWLAELDFHMTGRAATGESLIAKGTNFVSTFTLQPAGYIAQVIGTIQVAGQ